MKIPNDCLIPRLIIKIPMPIQTNNGKRKILINGALYGGDGYRLYFVDGSRHWLRYALRHPVKVDNCGHQKGSEPAAF